MLNLILIIVYCASDEGRPEKKVSMNSVCMM